MLYGEPGSSAWQGRTHGVEGERGRRDDSSATGRAGPRSGGTSATWWRAQDEVARTGTRQTAIVSEVQAPAELEGRAGLANRVADHQVLAMQNENLPPLGAEAVEYDHAPGVKEN